MAEIFNEYILALIFVVITGACIGSFLNVVALRAIAKESIIFPSSKCPKCNNPIKWYDNIPVLSYFLTFRGKCRSCGEKVSIQYPVVEAVSAVIFLAVFLAFGFTVKTLLLLILLCISIVITITDIKKEYIFNVHSWIFIITALIYSVYENDVNFAFTGFVLGALIMEVIARSAYYIVRKKNDENSEDTKIQSKEKSDSEEELSIDEYVSKYKRAFGEADTYIAAGAGALLGWKYFIAAVILAIVLQAFCILPQFLIKLYKQGEKRLLFSLGIFFITAALYFLLSNIYKLNIYLIFAFIIALIFFGLDTIIRIKKVKKQGYNSLPFGPALLITTFLTLFFGSYIIAFVFKYIFMFVQ